MAGRQVALGKDTSHVTPTSMFGFRVETCHACMLSGWFIFPAPDGSIYTGYFDANGLRKSPGGWLVDAGKARGLLEMVRWLAEAQDQAAELDAFGYTSGFADLIQVTTFEEGYRIDVDSTTFWERVKDLATSGRGDAIRLLEMAERRAEGPFKVR